MPNRTIDQTSRAAQAEQFVNDLRDQTATDQAPPASGRTLALVPRDPATGRFLTRPGTLAFEQSLIEVDADLYLAAMHQRVEMARVILASYVWHARADDLETLVGVEAGLIVRLGHEREPTP